MTFLDGAIAQEMAGKTWPDNVPPIRPWRLPDEERPRVHTDVDPQALDLENQFAGFIEYSETKEFFAMAARKSRGASSNGRAASVEALLAEYLGKQSRKPGPIFGAVLAKQDFYAAGANGVLYVYEDGVYVRAERVVKQRIQELAKESWSRYIQNEVEAWLVSNSHPLELDALGPNRINVLNGILEWTKSGWKLKKHSPRYRTPIQYPVRYDPRAKCPRYDAFLESSLPDPAVRDVADEWMGYCLTSDYRHHKALMTTGESGSGKSVYLEVLAALLGGQHNVSAVALSELTRDTFASADLYAKAANICTDIESAELRHTGLLKRLVAGETVRGQEKHKPAFHFRNTAKLAFSANEIPSSRDTTSAFFERWMVMIFPHRFRDTDRDVKNLHALITRDEREMSGVLNRAVAGFSRLRRQGYFTGSDSTDEAKRVFRERADAFAAWLIEMDPADYGRRERREWYQAYQVWCTMTGHQPLASSKFYVRLRRWDGALDMSVVRTASKGYEYFTIKSIASGAAVMG